MATKIPDRKIRGIRDSIPAGYVLGRVSSGEGDVQLIHMSVLGKQLVGASGGGSGAGGGVASSGSVQQVAQVVAGTTSALQTLLAQVIANEQDAPVFVQRKCGDETTAITAATGKDTFRVPGDLQLTEARASLTTAQATGSIFTVDIKLSGTTIFSTLLTIDNTETTSTRAATPAVLSTATLPDDAEMRIDVTQVGDGTAAGLKITLLTTRLFPFSSPSLDFSDLRNSQYLGVV